MLYDTKEDTTTSDTMQTMMAALNAYFEIHRFFDKL